MICGGLEKVPTNSTLRIPTGYRCTTAICMTFANLAAASCVPRAGRGRGKRVAEGLVTRDGRVAPVSVTSAARNRNEKFPRVC